jgi:sugar phosphate isomerase/epimerase
MKIGYRNHPRENVLEEIDWIGRNNFDFVDLFIEEDQAAPDKIDIEKTKKILKKYNLDVVGHCACYLPIGSSSRILRQAAIKEILRCFEVYKKLNTEFVTIHADWPNGLFSTEEGIAFQVETLREVVKKADDFGLNAMYEPINTGMDDIENVSAILNEVKGLFFHLDIGHANLFGKKPEEFIIEFHKKMKHVHLHDNNGYSDQHLPMGCGNINWEEVLECLKKYYDGTITVEVFSEERDYVLMNKDELLKLWK